MKFSEQWLRRWVNPEINTNDLVAQLTMAGLEVDSVAPVAAEFQGVVVGEVLAVEQHPDADRLKLCDVKIAADKPILKIVCGGANVRQGLKVAVATIGARLPNGLKIKKSKLRGAVSEGMLCSAEELGLAENAEGILELASDAPLGETLQDYLSLNDYTIEVELTPNRGDCLSIAGIAREVAALNRLAVNAPEITAAKIQQQQQFPVNIIAAAECPHYVGRIIQGIDATAATPMWLQEILRRSGLRSISAVVDVTNYVMLELGQPLHAFDLAKLDQAIEVRKAKQGETLELLDGQSVDIIEDTLLIADSSKPLALAGIMGGLVSSVTDATTDVFLESAFFTPAKIAGKARQYGLATDSSHRFERGVDPELQIQAIERATNLLLEIAGGKAGPLSEVSAEEYLPQSKIVPLRSQRVQQLLGLTISDEDIIDALQGLGMTVFTQGKRWEVHVPTYRFDIELEVDLIEEVARLYGYDKLPAIQPVAALIMQPHSESKLSLMQFTRSLLERGYHEAITYSFVDAKLQNLLNPDSKALALVNPISAELSQMRTNLWSGLVSALQYNQHRQQPRVRLFESGLRYVVEQDELIQQQVLSGIVAGEVHPEQWGLKAREVDFFDIKADVEALLNLTHEAANFTFIAATHPALHPGQCAKVEKNGEAVGWLGALHPRIEQTLQLQGPIFVFELQLALLQQATLPQFVSLSKYPAIRRDISFLVNKAISVREIYEKIAEVDNEILQATQVFDIYEGAGTPAEQKSLALSLTLQHATRTLTDDEVAIYVDNVVTKLKKVFKIVLRD